MSFLGAGNTIPQAPSARVLDFSVPNTIQIVELGAGRSATWVLGPAGYKCPKICTSYGLQDPENYCL